MYVVKTREIVVIVVTLADTAYLDNRSYGVHQLAAWIPLMDATKERGCMEVSFYREN